MVLYYISSFQVGELFVINGTGYLNKSAYTDQSAHYTTYIGEVCIHGPLIIHSNNHRCLMKFHI